MLQITATRRWRMWLAIAIGAVLVIGACLAAVWEVRNGRWQAAQVVLVVLAAGSGGYLLAPAMKLWQEALLLVVALAVMLVLSRKGSRRKAGD